MMPSGLIERLWSFADREFLVTAGQRLTYRDFLEKAAFWEKRLVRLDAKRGDVVAIEGDFSPDVCAAFFAMTAMGLIIVPLSAAADRERLLEIAEAGLVLSWRADGLRSEKRNVTARHDLLLRLRESGTPGLVLFTSGSTGEPKGIVHDLSRLLEKYKTVRPALRTLSFLLFDHLGGFNTMMTTLANGGCLIVPEGRTPEAVCRSLASHEVQLLPTTPSFLAMLLWSEAWRAHDLSRLEIISYGTEVMPETLLAKLVETFPHAEFRQTYGLSELGILGVRSKASNSVWMKIGGEGIETRVVEEQLHIRSKMAMLGYLNAPAPFDKDGWFDTRDQVECQGEWLRVLGRKSEIINVGGQKVFPARVEEVLLSMPEIKDAIVKAQPNPLLGNVVSAVVNVSAAIDESELKRRIRTFCRDKLERFQIPVHVTIREEGFFSERFKKMRA